MFLVQLQTICDEEEGKQSCKISTHADDTNAFLPSLLFMLDLLLEKQGVLQEFLHVSQMWRGSLHAFN